MVAKPQGIHKKNGFLQLFMVRKKILIVDDDPLIVFLILKYFSERGYDVVGTTSPGAVLSLINPNMLDVLISDLHMGTLSGIDMIKQLRSTGFAGKIILISASCREIRKDIDSLEVNGFFDKPFELQDIHNKIKEWMNENNSIRV